ncbi:hypothetical protein ACFWD7_04530 [Streptomyces mirabilis]|uniref:hypothetical protein n=1 Tax=Streptomyces mirabilis TaxID=68239 RepID=UPI0021C0F878|nr:hypothetical protein [Streptomyces mirabilis]MCT9113271.1 hypothetical protein [Streptomyces mirabilis]
MDCSAGRPPSCSGCAPAIAGSPPPPPSRSVTVTVAYAVSSAVTAGLRGTTYALSGGLAALLAGRPNDGFTLRRVDVRRPRTRYFW